MELPTEVIYEISLHDPFHSFMPFLSKTTKKYWETKTLWIDTYKEVRPNPYKIDLLVWENIDNSTFNDMVEKYREILREVRFLKIFVIVLDSTKTEELRSKLQKLESVDFSDNYITQSCFYAFSNIKMTNHNYMLRCGDGDVVKSKYPDLIDTYNHYCAGTIFTYNRYLKIMDNKIVFEIFEDILNRDIAEKITNIPYIEIRNIGYDGNLKTTIENLYQLPKFKKCSIYFTTRKVHWRKVKTLKKLKAGNFGIPFKYIDMETYIEITF